MKIESAYFSYAGPKHENEDALLLPLESKGAWWAAIADGVGGHEGGQLASRAVIEKVRSLIESDSGADIRSLFVGARERLQELAEKNTDLSRMATTLSLIKFAEITAEVGHVGDTRIYHLRGQGILDRTQDQTEMRHLIEQGILNKARARKYPRRGVLLSVLSAERNYELYESDFDVQKKDRIILLSDGAYNKISRREIRDMSLVSASSRELCIKIEQQVSSRGPEDDHTVLCLTLTL